MIIARSPAYSVYELSIPKSMRAVNMQTAFGNVAKVILYAATLLIFIVPMSASIAANVGQHEKMTKTLVDLSNDLLCDLTGETELYDFYKNNEENGEKRDASSIKIAYQTCQDRLARNPNHDIARYFLVDAISKHFIDELLMSQDEGKELTDLFWKTVSGGPGDDLVLRTYAAFAGIAAEDVRIRTMAVDMMKSAAAEGDMAAHSMLIGLLKDEVKTAGELPELRYIDNAKTLNAQQGYFLLLRSGRIAANDEGQSYSLAASLQESSNIQESISANRFLATIEPDNSDIRNRLIAARHAANQGGISETFPLIHALVQTNDYHGLSQAKFLLHAIEYELAKTDSSTQWIKTWGVENREQAIGQLLANYLEFDSKIVGSNDSWFQSLYDPWKSFVIAHQASELDGALGDLHGSQELKENALAKRQYAEQILEYYPEIADAVRVQGTSSDQWTGIDAWNVYRLNTAFIANGLDGELAGRALDIAVIKGHPDALLESLDSSGPFRAGDSSYLQNLKMLSDKGSGEAAYRLAGILSDGLGVPIDLKSANKYYQRAISLNYLPAVRESQELEHSFLRTIPGDSFDFVIDDALGYLKSGSKTYERDAASRILTAISHGVAVDFKQHGLSESVLVNAALGEGLDKKPYCVIARLVASEGDADSKHFAEQLLLSGYAEYGDCVIDLLNYYLDDSTISPSKAEFWFNIATNAVKSDNFTQALELAHRLLYSSAFSRNVDQADLLLSNMIEKLIMWNDANDLYQRFVLAAATRLMGEVKLRQGNNQSAKYYNDASLVAIKSLLDASPKDGDVAELYLDALFGRVTIFMQLQNKKMAIECLDIARKEMRDRWPNRSEPRLALFKALLDDNANPNMQSGPDVSESLPEIVSTESDVLSIFSSDYAGLKRDISKAFWAVLFDKSKNGFGGCEEHDDNLSNGIEVIQKDLSSYFNRGRERIGDTPSVGDLLLTVTGLNLFAICEVNNNKSFDLDGIKTIVFNAYQIWRRAGDGVTFADLFEFLVPIHFLNKIGQYEAALQLSDYALEIIQRNQDRNILGGRFNFADEQAIIREHLQERLTALRGLYDIQKLSASVFQELSLASFVEAQLSNLDLSLLISRIKGDVRQTEWYQEVTDAQVAILNADRSLEALTRGEISPQEAIRSLLLAAISVDIDSTNSSFLRHARQNVVKELLSYYGSESRRSLVLPIVGDKKTLIGVLTDGILQIFEQNWNRGYFISHTEKLKSLMLQPIGTETEALLEALITMSSVLPSELRECTKERLDIANDGFVSSLPLAAILADGTVANFQDAARQQLFLGQRCGLNILPTLYIDEFRVADTRSDRFKHFAGIGNPKFDIMVENSLADALNDLTDNYTTRGVDVRGLVPLPDTLQELTEIAAFFENNELLLGKDATIDKTIDLLSGEFDVISFATHGLSAGSLEGLNEPALALTPDDQSNGLLTGSTIRQLELKGALVTLSACSTSASAGGLRSDSYSGLVAPFFEAGAGGLVATQWPVETSVARRFNTQMIRTLVERGVGSIAESMQEIFSTLLDEADSEEQFDPRFWAPFVVLQNAN